MVTKSNNKDGNPYHDDDGRFTTAEGGNSTSKKEEDGKSSNISYSKVEAPKIKLKGSISLDSLVNKLDDLNQCANVPRLDSARDIEEHIEEYFSKQVCRQIDNLYGKSEGCASYQYKPKNNPSKILELFPNILAKNRYKDNHAHYIDNNEFIKLRGTRGFIHNMRGMSSTGQKARDIMDSYVNPDLESFDLLCPCGGNCYGSNIYTTTDRQTALNYSGYYGTIIDGCYDIRGAYTKDTSTLANIRSKLDFTNINNRVAQCFINNGVDPMRANKIASSFEKATKRDIGIIAILLGVDYFEAHDGQSQINILNASRWYIKR